jgi:deoxyhypusine synthase
MLERGRTKVKAFLNGREIDPKPVDGNIKVSELVDSVFQAFNAARLREACHLFARRFLSSDVTVGVSLSGALTPAGLGMSCLVPLIENGFVDWIVSTGANLYHDTHFGTGLNLYQGQPAVSDVELRREGVVRIYDIFFEYDVLLSTDEFFRKAISGDEFQREMGSAQFHHLIGKYLLERERALAVGQRSVLAAATQHGVPIYTPSPGDSSIGMNVAAMALQGSKLRIDVSRDVNETAAIVLEAKRSGGKSAVLLLGGGSPKNFVLQTEPQIQEVLGLDEKGHDYFIQITDARPDTGGLSGATPAEAVSWGKVDPARLPDAVVCYLDCTVALPILTAYALAKQKPRVPKRIYDRLSDLLARLESDYAAGAQHG